MITLVGESAEHCGVTEAEAWTSLVQAVDIWTEIQKGQAS